jgi:hypothetical protein
MYRLELTLLGLPKMTNCSNNHWRSRQAEAKKWKSMVASQIILQRLQKPALPLTKAKIVFTRYSSKMPDFDGLVSGCKHLLDGLKIVVIIADDNPLIIGQPEYKWLQAKRNEGRIEIIVEEVA